MFMYPSSIIHHAREMEVKAFLEWERKEVVKMLDDCLEMCSLKQVPSEKILIEKESVTAGISELVSRLSIQTLVMGAGANSRFLRSIAPPDSDTANYVLNCAPDFCHV
ncbi:U-box domain-containing protein 33-like [Amaranthus tricolor]|uniref:U-box domain-containing protein 33-like n=1 Tax=Amaranthus tricolor TaxID=29722 RepID=UPI00258A22FC|nr:U-box domain-containing protein 33-like [Amaranthus tricolor]